MPIRVWIVHIAASNDATLAAWSDIVGRALEANAYRSKHSYLSGLLLDRQHASEAVDAFLEFVGRVAEIPWRRRGWDKPRLRKVGAGNTAVL